MYLKVNVFLSLCFENSYEHFFISHVCLSVRGWTSAFLLAVHRLCGVIEGRLSHFLI